MKLIIVNIRTKNNNLKVITLKLTTVINAKTTALFHIFFFTQFERCFNTVSTLIHYEEIESIVAAMTATFLAKVDRPPIA